MKKILFLLIFCNHILFAQQSIDIIYIDNNKTIERQDIIKTIIKPTLYEIGKNSSKFLLLFSNDDFDPKQNLENKGDAPWIITDTMNKQVINQWFNYKIGKAEFNDNIKFITRELDTKFNDYLVLGSGLKGNTNIIIHLFVDIENISIYNFHDNFLNKILLLYNLRNRNGITKNCQVNYYISYNKEAGIESEYNNLIEILNNEQYINVKVY